MPDAVNESLGFSLLFSECLVTDCIQVHPLHHARLREDKGDQKSSQSQHDKRTYMVQLVLDLACWRGCKVCSLSGERQTKGKKLGLPRSRLLLQSVRIEETIQTNRHVCGSAGRRSCYCLGNGCFRRRWNAMHGLERCCCYRWSHGRRCKNALCCLYR